MPEITLNIDQDVYNYLTAYEVDGISIEQRLNTVVRSRLMSEEIHEIETLPVLSPRMMTLASIMIAEVYSPNAG